MSLIACSLLFAEQYPSSWLQVKRAVCWNSKLKNVLSFGFLVLRHLNSQDKARVAKFLTGCNCCNIDVFFSRTHVLVMRLDGLSDNILLRFAQNAEVPIPACPAQGGFQVNFYPKSDGVLTWTSCSVGRIGSFDHVPAQVQLDASEQERPIEGFKWLIAHIEKEIEATCFQKVLCKPENQDSTVCLQFLIPISLEKKLPLHIKIEGKQFCVDHPAPFTVPLSISRRPPEEQDKFEHWKETAKRSFSHRKGRHNSLSHSPKLVDSLCRFNLLRHAELLSSGKHYPAMFEDEFFPFLFVDGTPDLDDVLEFCSHVFSDNKLVGSSITSAIDRSRNRSVADIHLNTHTLCALEVVQDKQDPLKIGRFVCCKGNHFSSTTETLLCHAFTTCYIVVVVPKGNTIDQVCASRDAYRILKRIPLHQRPLSSGGTAYCEQHNGVTADGARGRRPNAGVDPRDLSYVNDRDIDDNGQLPTGIRLTLLLLGLMLAQALVTSALNLLALLRSMVKMTLSCSRLMGLPYLLLLANPMALMR